MAQITGIKVDVVTDGVTQSRDDLWAMLDRIELRGVSPSFGDRFADFVDGSDLKGFVFRNEARDLVRSEGAHTSATGACVLEAIKVLPSDRYLELFSALADELDLGTVIDWHGWPVLSVGIGTTTVAEGAVAASTAPEAHSALEEIGPEAHSALEEIGPEACPCHAVPATGTAGSLQGNARG